jgi:hypothetical protein
VPHRPRSSARPVTRRRGRRAHLRPEYQQPLDLERAVIVLNVSGDFVAAKPTLESFTDRRSAIERENTRVLKTLFHEQAERWKKETRHWSSVTKMLAHPSYLRIVGLTRLSTNNELERLLLHELESEPDYWFDALAAVTGDDPVRPECDFDRSVNAWLDWGRQKGIIGH